MTEQAFYAAIGFRAQKIVARLCPMPPVAHGWHQRDAFLERARRRGTQGRLYSKIFWKLVAKEEAKLANAEAEATAYSNGVE